MILSLSLWILRVELFGVKFLVTRISQKTPLNACLSLGDRLEVHRVYEQIIYNPKLKLHFTSFHYIILHLIWFVALVFGLLFFMFMFNVYKFFISNLPPLNPSPYKTISLFKVFSPSKLRPSKPKPLWFSFYQILVPSSPFQKHFSVLLCQALL